MINLYGNLQVKLANTEADRLTYTPLVGEPIWCAETNLYYMGDGSTVGGILVNNNSDLQVQLDQLRADLDQEILDRETGDEALGASIDVVAGDLVDEANARIAGDEQLQTNIDNEVDAREAADNALQINITAEENARIAADGVLQDNIDAEAGYRADADTVLQTNIDNETNAREAADANLQIAITAEETARIAADNALDSRLDSAETAIGGLVVDLAAEITARQAGDANLQTQINDINNDIADVNAEQLQTNIDNEVVARETADTTLQTNIDNETNARESADGALGVRIDNETADRIAADLTLQGNITTEETARIAADTTITNNLNTHIADVDNPHDVTKAQVGLGNVDNTSDLNKPISTATQTALDTKADATWVDTELDNINSTLNLKANTADLAPVAFSGSYDDLEDLPTIPAAQVNSDWNASSGVAQILNKPTTLAGYGITDAINVSQKGANNGVATLGADGKIPSTQIPAIALGEVYEVDSEAEMLALDAQSGDMAIRTDISTNFIHNSGTSGTITDWTQLLTPPNAVLSVNGQTGIVVLDADDVGLGDVDNTSDLDKPISTATQAALDGKVDDFTAQTANTVFAAPNGSTGLPVFRSLVVADIPSLSSLYVINGRTVSAGTGLTGGGDLSANRTISLDSFSVASLALADSSVQTIVQGSGIIVDATDPNNPIVSATATAPTWGAIVGTLSDQTDLQTALNAKANTSSLATVATSGLFADLLSKPTTLSGYGITDAVPNTRTVTAGNGVTGGGALSGNITLTLGTPSTLTAATTNAVTSTSHTHAITGFLALTGGTMTGAILGPNGSATAASFAVRAAGYGMYSSAADNLDFAVTGTRVLNLERGEIGATNYFKFINNAATDALFGPDLTVEGTQADISMFLIAKGDGRVSIGNGINSEVLSIGSYATPNTKFWMLTGVNYSELYSTSSNSTMPTMYYIAEATAAPTAGNNMHIFQSYVTGGSNYNMLAVGTRSTVTTAQNYVGIDSNNSTGAPLISVDANSAGTNVNLEIQAKGTGVVNVLSTLQQNGTAVVLQNRTVSAGVGLSGGGALSANQTISMGTPSTLTAATTNSASGSTHTHAITGFLPLTGGTLTGALSGTDLTLSGTGVGRMVSVTANATGNLTTTVLNRIVKKTNTTAYTYNIPASLGADDDTITVVNAGSAGDITVAGTGGVTLYSGGVSGSVTVPAYSTRTFVRVSSTIWVA